MKHPEVFGEQISTGKIKRRSVKEGGSSSYRYYLLYIALLLMGLVLFLRLGYLQVVRGNYYSTLSDNNRTRTEVIYATRGIIYDRNKTPLVYNIPGFKQSKGNVSRVIDKDTALELLAKGDDSVYVDSMRQYPYGEATSHVLGYIGPISEEQLKRLGTNYTHESWIGVSGIEKRYENILRGIDGKELIETDALGQKVQTLGSTDPISGQDVNLTIDIKLQEASYKALKDVKRGAVVVSKPNGEVLALVSKPSFDSNIFTQGDLYTATSSAYKTAEDVLADKENFPLLDRAISGTYPPGSTFKLITAAAGLVDNVIDENYTVDDNGIIRIGPYSFSNWYFTKYGRTDGVVDIVKAISRSNDIFFYKLAEKVGVDKLADMGRKFGLGSKLGIDLDGEESGILPSRQWKESALKGTWYLGDTFIYGIGQGYLLTTPLQVNSWTAVVANGSDLYRPHLNKDKNPEVITKNILDTKSANLIRKGMIQSCSEGGVAYPLFDFEVKNSNLKVDNRNILDAPKATTSAGFKDYRKVVVACKTGTAEQGGKEDHPHAWITLFAPAYNPEIVVTVLAEESGEGSQVAAPIAKEILESYFTNKTN